MKMNLLDPIPRGSGRSRVPLGYYTPEGRELLMYVTEQTEWPEGHPARSTKRLRRPTYTGASLKGGLFFKWLLEFGESIDQWKVLSDKLQDMDYPPAKVYVQTPADTAPRRVLALRESGSLKDLIALERLTSTRYVKMVFPIQGEPGCVWWEGWGSNKVLVKRYYRDSDPKI